MTRDRNRRIRCCGQLAVVDDRPGVTVEGDETAVEKRGETRSFETVAAPSGNEFTLVSHSTLPVARSSASTSPVARPAGFVGTG